MASLTEVPMFNHESLRSFLAAGRQPAWRPKFIAKSQDNRLRLVFRTTYTIYALPVAAVIN
jgi:hypothetical protein